MQSYFNPETQRVKSLWQTYHALFVAAQQQQSAFLRCLAFAALSATLFGMAIGLLYPLLLALEQTEAGQSAVIFLECFVWRAFNRQPPFPHLGGIL